MDFSNQNYDLTMVELRGLSIVYTEYIKSIDIKSIYHTLYPKEFQYHIYVRDIADLFDIDAISYDYKTSKAIISQKFIELIRIKFPNVVYAIDNNFTIEQFNPGLLINKPERKVFNLCSYFIIKQQNKQYFITKYSVECLDMSNEYNNPNYYIKEFILNPGYMQEQLTDTLINQLNSSSIMKESLVYMECGKFLIKFKTY